MFGFRSRTAVRSHEGQVVADLAPEDRPQFARTYKALVGDGFTVKVCMRTYIDRDLYPLVQAAVDKILALDAAFVASKPREFVDETGTTWRRT